MASYLTIWALLITSSLTPANGTPRFKVMTTATSVAVTWNESDSFTVNITSRNVTSCRVSRGQLPRICVLVGLEPATPHDVIIVGEDGWTELYRGTHYTKPLAPRELRWLGSSHESIVVQWQSPIQEVHVETYTLKLVRQANNMTEYQDYVSSRESTITRKLWLPSTYGIAYGTSFKLYVWSVYETERSTPAQIDVYSAPRPVSLIVEDVARRSNISAVVVWQKPDVGGVTGYRLVIESRMFAQIQFPMATNDARQSNVTVDGTWTNYTFNRLTPATPYDVSIWALYHGAESSVKRYTTIYTDPSPVKYLTVSYWTTDAVTLSWLHDDPYLPVGFDYVITATSGDHRRQERVVSSAVSTEIRYLRPGYKYNIDIIIKMSTHPYGTSQPVNTTVQLRPDPVQYIRFDNITSGSVNVSWLSGRFVQDSFSVRYHGIYVQKYWSSPVLARRTWIVLTDMFPGETYYVGVRAYSGGQPSTEVTGTVTIAPLPPGALSVPAANISDTSAVIDIAYNSTRSANTEWNIVYGVWQTGRTTSMTVPAGQSTVVVHPLIPARLYTVWAYGRTTGGLQSDHCTDHLTFITRPVFKSAMTPSVGSRRLTVIYQYSPDTFDGYVFTLYPGDVKRFKMKYDKPEVTYHNLLPGTLYTVTGQVHYEQTLSEGRNVTVLTKPEVLVRCGRADNSSVELLFDQPAGQVDSYLIQCNPGCAYGGTRIPKANSGVSVFKVTELDPETRYEYLVRSVRVADRLTEESRSRIIYCWTTNGTAVNKPADPDPTVDNDDGVV